MPNTTATAPLDTTHVTRLPSGDFPPAPRLAYAMVHIAIVQWDRFYDEGAWQEIAVGVDHVGPLPVRIPAGKRINECVGYSPASGDEIRAAFACSREDYMEALRREAADALAAEQNYCEF